MSVGKWFPVFQRTVVSSLSVKQSCVPRSLKPSTIMLQEFRISHLHNLLGEKIETVQQHTQIYEKKMLRWSCAYECQGNCNSFICLPLYHHRKSCWYPLKSRIGEPHSQCAGFGEDKNLLPQPEIEQFLSCPAHNLVITLIVLSQFLAIWRMHTNLKRKVLSNKISTRTHVFDGRILLAWIL